MPCRVRLESGRSVKELLQSVHQSNLETLAWQQASLKAIQKALGIVKLWDCLFTYQPLVEDESPNGIWRLSLSSGSDQEIQIEVGPKSHSHQQRTETYF